MLKRSPASREGLSAIANTEGDKQKTEPKLVPKSHHQLDSKSSSEGFSTADNRSSTSTSIEEQPKDSLKSSATVIDCNVTESGLHNYKLDMSAAQTKPDFSIQIPRGECHKPATQPSSAAASHVDPIDSKALPEGEKPLDHTLHSGTDLSLPSAGMPECEEEAGQDSKKQSHPFTAPETQTDTRRSVPVVARHNSFPMVPSDVAFSRHSMVTTATDRSSMARFNDIDTIKIPDRYQKAELTSMPKRLSQATVHSQAKRPVHTGRTSKSASFISTKGKTNVRYHIPEPQDRQVLSQSEYVKVYDLVTGIRSSVSRCAKAPPTINDEHFSEVSKLIFDRVGNSQAPPTKYEFKFKDYFPEVFRDLRSMFGISQAEYLISFQDEVGVRQYGSSGKSGSCFYYSNDQKFIIKTVHHSEHLHLRKILKQYYYYVKKNPNTFICQFYGLHRLKVPTPTGSEKIHILVMNNIFPPNKKMHRTYDLKGSTLGRRTTRPDACQKDLNFLENREQLHLSTSKRVEFMSQLTKDINLLKTLNTMDYSLLLGIHDISQGIEDQQAYGLYLGASVTESYQRNKLLDSNGGIRAVGDNNENLNLVYYLGVIDCLTNYSTRKRLETFFRSLKHDRHIISAVPPDEYSRRFLEFITAGIKTPEGEKPKSRLQNLTAGVKSRVKKTKQA